MSFKYNILIVDDISSNIESLSMTIKSAFDNINIFTALSAKDGFDILYENSIDLILLDIQMPEMDGYEFARILSQNTDTKMIPIVFVTAIFTSDDFIQTGLDLGAIDYITKPINGISLINKLKLYIKILEKQKSLEIALENEKNSKQKIQKQHDMLIKQSKMATMGEMIGNISHQMKQPLNAISLSILTLEMHHNNDLLDDSKMIKSKEKITRLTEYLSDTIDNFRDFFNPNKVKTIFKIKDCIDDSIGIAGATLKDNFINTTFDIDETLNIDGFQNELSQVVINILNNAKDALVSNKTKQPTINIKARKVLNSIAIEISDNAGGIDEDIISKIFDSYFTTKDEDKGTGLGLYMSKEIIENMGGDLTVSNHHDCDDGAVFTIKLPINKEKN